MYDRNNTWMDLLTARAGIVLANRSKSGRGSKRRNDNAAMMEQLEDRRLFSGVLGTASAFAVLGASTVTNTGATAILGSVGVSPGSAITGFPPGVDSGGAIHANDSAAIQAHSDLVAAYGVIAGEASPAGNNLTGQDLGGLTLTPGVYHFASAAQLTGTLTLDAQNNPNARFDFQIGGTLTTASASAIHLINGGQFDNVYFQVGTSATIGIGTTFVGNILADQSITVNTNASMLEGRALALVGAVTLDTNHISASEADLSVANSGASSVFAGNNITYTETVVDAGPNAANNLVLSDPIPAGATFVSDTQTSGPAFTLSNPTVGGTGTITGTLSNMLSGGSATFAVVVHVSPSTVTGTSIVNTASVSSDTFDPNTANNSQIVTTAVQTQADVSVTETAATGTVPPGSTLAYTVTVANSGPSDAQSVAMSSPIPTGATFISVTQTSGPAFTLSHPTVGGTGTVSGTLATLGSGVSATFVVDVLIPAGTPGGTSIVDTTTVTATTADASMLNNSATVTRSVTALPTVSSVSPSSGLASGGTLVTITGTNFTGATAVNFGATLGTNVTVVNATTITANDPAGTSGVVNVTVTTPGGISATSASDRFSYVTASNITSLASASFTAGLPGTFTVTTSGSPTPTLTTTTLPLGLTFADNHNGTATLSGTPASAAGGDYSLTITANNGVGSPATQTFALTVLQVPAITTPAAATFVVAQTMSFTVRSTGFPMAALSETGPLPSGLTFVDNHDGTATISGTAAAASDGTYALTLDAANGISPVASQSFLLSVDQTAPASVPVITESAYAQMLSPTSSTGTLHAQAEQNGTDANLTYTWSIVSQPTVASGSLAPLALFSFNGTNAAKDTSLTLLASGEYTLQVTATNGIQSAISQVQVTTNLPQTVTVATTQVSSVTSLSNGSSITGFVVNFNGPVDPTSAQNVLDYRILGQQTTDKGRSFWQHLFGENARTQTTFSQYKIASAVYDSQTDSTTLTLKSPMPLHNGIRLVKVFGIGAHAVLAANGQPIDGNANGTAGGTFTYRFSTSVAKHLSYQTANHEAVDLSLSGPGKIFAVLPSGSKMPVINLIGTVSTDSILTGQVRKGHNSVAAVVLDELNGTANADIQLGTEFHINQTSGSAVL